MTSKVEIIEQARTWIGTKFHAATSNKGIGCDCLGFVIGVSTILRIKTKAGITLKGFDQASCSPHLNVKEADKIIDRHFFKKDLKSLEAGDLILFDIAGYNAHLGILGSLKYNANTHLSLIHADSMKGEVCEHLLDKKWIKRIAGVYGFFAN